MHHISWLGLQVEVLDADGEAVAEVTAVEDASRAAQAGFRVGAGLVQVCSASENREILQASLPDAIFVDAADGSGLSSALAEADAVAIGPGMGTDAWAEALVQAVRSSGAGRIHRCTTIDLQLSEIDA